MSSYTLADADKPHAVCIPYPAQGHINPMLKLAKLLHHYGFYVTFVNTEYNHKRLLRSRGPNSLDGLPDICFKTIPDGLPPSDADTTQDIPSLCVSVSENCLGPFRDLLHKLNGSASSNVPQVTCIVSDTGMGFAAEVAREFGIPNVGFCPSSACSGLCYALLPRLVEEGVTPVTGIKYMVLSTQSNQSSMVEYVVLCKRNDILLFRMFRFHCSQSRFLTRFTLICLEIADGSGITKEYLDKVIDWIPGGKKIRFRDLPSYVRTTDPNDRMLSFLLRELRGVDKASAIVFNTFDSLEQDVLEALSAIFPPIYTIGPLHLLVDQIRDDELKFIASNLWTEQTECINWLDSKEPNSVVYVNFGSVAVITPDQLIEFAWGLANSKQQFLWIIRPDLVIGEAAILPLEFVSETQGRGILAGWCPQEQVLKHPSIGGFLSHMGWNSTIESISSGVPMVCRPFLADQQTNCRFACVEWGIGMEIDDHAKRDQVEILVKELMEGEKAVELKAKAMEWKKNAQEAVKPGGSSYHHLDELLVDFLLSEKHINQLKIKKNEN
ncbi:7-deoxyloganetin glucosyltransferase-like [Durio zibethinus]|uniref:7-deoxyloganetin glucosyltransferase-like n=1 Tax=Durio zibethinus TaxID=66656 RepID=A0A6P6AFV8_DURZI|nr:7-deoxyloganetin glucosyltransferase-like [Durio zibethinus]